MRTLLGATASTEEVTVISHVTDTVSMGMGFRWPSGALELGTAQRWVVPADGPAHLALHVGEGFFASPTGVRTEAGLSLSVGLLGGVVSERRWFVAGLVVPAAYDLVGPGALRLPVLAELQGGGRIGPVALTAWLQTGAIFVISSLGDELRIALQPGLSVQFFVPNRLRREPEAAQD